MAEEMKEPKTPAEIRTHLLGMIAVTKRAIERLAPNTLARAHAVKKLDEARHWLSDAFDGVG